MRRVVLFPGALGDFCLLAPALAALLADGERIALSVQRSLQALAAVLLPGAEPEPPIDGVRFTSLFGGDPDPALVARLRDADRVHAWLARGDPDGRVAASLRARGVRVEWHRVVCDDGDRHAADEYAAALGRRGPLLPLRVTPPTVPDLAIPWQASPAARVLIHPGSGGRAKRWEADGFALVIAMLRAAGRAPAVLLGPAEHDEVDAWRGRGVAVADGLDLVPAAAVIGAAPVWIGNDSGMSHLANVLGRRGVVLFGPTRAARFGPRDGGLVTIDVAGRARADVAREICAHVLAADGT